MLYAHTLMSPARGIPVSENNDIGKSPVLEVPRPRDVRKIVPAATTVHRLNENRRALLKEIDNAKFS